MEHSDKEIKKSSENQPLQSKEGCDGGNVCALLDRYKNLNESYSEAVGCAVCDHPRKDEIDKMLKEGHDYAVIKEKYHVSKCALELYVREYLKRQ
jgi:hypothetical protein